MKENPGPERLIAQMKSLNERLNGFNIKSVLRSENDELLRQFMPFKSFVNLQSGSFGLRRNGEFYFNYATPGFSGIVCFDGSHIAIQTDPGKKHLKLDVFLSDKILNNINIAEGLYRDAIKFFQSEVITEEYLST